MFDDRRLLINENGALLDQLQLGNNLIVVMHEKGGKTD